MHTNGCELRIRHRHGGLRDTAVGAWSKHWDHWGCHGALDCRCTHTEMDSQFARCSEEVDYELWLIDILKWMHEQSQLDDRPALRY